MDEEFKDELKILVETLLNPKNLVIKKINNIELTAAELRSYIDVYFRVFQSNDIVGAQSLYELTVTEQMNILIQNGVQTYKEKLIKSNCIDTSHFVQKINDAHHDSKKVAIDQFDKAQKMGSARVHLKFKNLLEMKIEKTFREWKVDAIQNHEKLVAEVRKTLEKEAENNRLKQEKLKAYQDHQDTIKNIQRNNVAYSQQQLEKYNTIARQLEAVQKQINDQKRYYKNTYRQETKQTTTFDVPNLLRSIF
ncbi:unnamed protein product, partial [Diamesa tonsa]